MDWRIAYTRSDGGGAIVTPIAWARKVSAVTMAGKCKIIDPPRPLDLVAGRPVDLTSMQAFAPEWAESEDEFLSRVKGKAVPPEATDIIVVRVSELPDLKDRHAFVIRDGKLTVDPDKPRVKQYLPSPDDSA